MVALTSVVAMPATTITGIAPGLLGAPLYHWAR